ncbi:MAG: DUF4238 domain-containing protein [Hyphomicrobiales bacterium]|nr:MAG: DUF4238 domain-containing protein [Hyphomicrobiales bacterium]
MVAAHPNAPSKHHYIPECYLKAWSSDGGRFCEFKRGYANRVRRRWTSPGGTGYALDLYAIPELGENSGDIESLFLRMVDTRAAALLDRLRNDDPRDFDARDRSVWATFLMSLLLRNPESIGAIKAAIVERWNAPRPELQKLYEDHYKKDGDPDSVDEYLARDGSNGAYRLLYDMIPDVMTHKRVGTFIVNMHWRVVTVPMGVREFLTSDRPIITTNGLAIEDGHLAIPISPRKLFIASRAKAIADQIVGMRSKDLVARTNQLIVERAKKFVFATDQQQARFIENRISKEQIPTLGETIAKNADW